MDLNKLLKVDISKAIIQMVELALPRFTKNQVLVIPVEYKFNASKPQRILLNFIFYRPANYTFVGTVYDQEFINLSENTKITYHSYHDSCWRSDGVESTINKFVQNLSKRFKTIDDVYITFGWTIGNVKGSIDFVDREQRVVKFVKGEGE